MLRARRQKNAVKMFITERFDGCHPPAAGNRVRAPCKPALRERKQPTMDWHLPQIEVFSAIL